MKQLTGGDKITARFLFQEFFDFYPTFKIWLAVNHKPVIQGVDNGIWRRVRLIPFEVTIPPERQRRNLGTLLLEEEGPGILAWAVRGCLAWQQDGLKVPAKVAAATAEYRQDSDGLVEFIKSRCVVAGNGIAAHTLTVPGGALYVEYAAFCEASGTDPWHKNVFGVALKERGFSVSVRHVKGRSARVYSGIALRSERGEPSEEVTDDDDESEV